MKASTLAWKVGTCLAGQGYFWFRDDFEEFRLVSKMAPGREGCNSEGRIKRKALHQEKSGTANNKEEGERGIILDLEASNWTLHPTSSVCCQEWFASFLPSLWDPGIYKVPNTAPPLLSTSPSHLAQCVSKPQRDTPSWSPQPKPKKHRHTVASLLPERLSLLGCRSRKDLLII